MFEFMTRNKKADFQDTFAEFVRSRQEEQLKQIQIPTARFKDEQFIQNLFISYGRITKNVDTTTFQNKIAIVTTDGELWTGVISPEDCMSILTLQITAEEIAELDSQY